MEPAKNVKLSITSPFWEGPVEFSIVQEIAENPENRRLFYTKICQHVREKGNQILTADGALDPTLLSDDQIAVQTVLDMPKREVRDIPNMSNTPWRTEYKKPEKPLTPNPGKPFVTEGDVKEREVLDRLNERQDPYHEWGGHRTHEVPPERRRFR